MLFAHSYPWQMITASSKPLRLSLNLQKRFDLEKIRREVDSILEKLTPATQSGFYHKGGWTAVCLVAANGNYAEDRLVEGARYLKTEALQRGSYLESIIDGFECEPRRVRILNLEPKKHIFWHCDYDDTIDKGNVRLHIPVYTNKKFLFQLSHEDVFMPPGQLWYGEFSFPHRLYNGGDERRTHLVMDLVAGDVVRKMIPESYLSEARRRQKVRALCQWLCRAHSLKRSVPARVMKKAAHSNLGRRGGSLQAS